MSLPADQHGAAAAITVLHGGGGDQHHQQQAEGVDEDVPLATIDFLAGVIAAGDSRPGVGAAHRLGVDDAGGRRS